MTLGNILDKLKRKKAAKNGLVGITVSEQEIAIAYICHGQDSPTLNFCEKITIPTDQAQHTALQNKVDELELHGTPCNYVLGPGDYKLLLIEAPKVNPNEMVGAVKWKIKDLIDIPPDNTVLSLFNVPKDAYRNQSEMIYVAVSRKDRIAEIVTLIETSGLKLEVIDIPELSMNNLSQYYDDGSTGLAFIDLLGSGSTMNMCKQGAIYLSRHLNTSVGQEIMASSEWETVRERLVLEVQRSLDYYESQMGQRHISKLLIAPRQDDSEQMVQQLNEAMAVEVEVMDIAGKLNSKMELPMDLQQSCMIAIGGALRLEQVQL